MTRILHWASGMFFVVAVILLAFGVRETSLSVGQRVSTATAESGSPVPAGPINPASIRVDLGQINNRGLTHFEVKLTNVSPRSAKIVGTPSTCVKAGCVVVDNPPVAILPNETATFHLICEAKTAGAFRLDTTIYLDFGDPIGVSVPITVIASVVDPTLNNSSAKQKN
jgi:hypothetical protein